MNKVKFYQFLIAGLLICNIVLLAFCFLGKKGKHKPKSKIIIERLDFNKEQVENYEKLIVNHRKIVSQNADKIKDLKKILYATLPTESRDSIQVDSLQSQISIAKANIENAHYNHFLDIKKLCTLEQLPKFSKLSKEMARLFAPHKKPKKRR